MVKYISLIRSNGSWLWLSGWTQIIRLVKSKLINQLVSKISLTFRLMVFNWEQLTWPFRWCRLANPPTDLTYLTNLMNYILITLLSDLSWPMPLRLISVTDLGASSTSMILIQFNDLMKSVGGLWFIGWSLLISSLNWLLNLLNY